MSKQKDQFMFTLNDIVTAVVPALEKALQPKVDHLEHRIESEFNTLAAMTNKQFSLMQKEMNKLAWKVELMV